MKQQKKESKDLSKDSSKDFAQLSHHEEHPEGVVNWTYKIDEVFRDCEFHDVVNVTINFTGGVGDSTPPGDPDGG